MRLDHVTVEVPYAYLDRAAHWYEDIFGLAPVESNREDARWFVCGDIQLHIIGAKRWESNLATRAHLALRASPGAYGVIYHRAISNIIHDDWDNRHFYIRDPWGNRIEVLQ